VAACLWLVLGWERATSIAKVADVQGIWKIGWSLLDGGRWVVFNFVVPKAGLNDIAEIFN
jgi:hypothetical protein